VIDELALLKLHPETASTKQKIIDLLSNEYPLTAKSIHSKLQRLYSSEISYQGVHKLLKEMETQKVIEKKKNEYLLNIEWIQKSKKTMERVEQKYLQNNKIVIPEDFSGSIQIEFDSMTDLCVSTAELLLSRKLATDRIDFICTLEYGWWPFKFKFEHFHLLHMMVKANPACKNIIRKKTPFGEWVRKEYNKIGAVSAPLGTKVNFENDLFVQGDSIIQINFDKDTKAIIESYYKKWNSLEGAFIDFALEDEPKIQATILITKNPVMAEYWRKHLTKVLEESLKGAKK